MICSWTWAAFPGANFQLFEKVFANPSERRSAKGRVDVDNPCPVLSSLPVLSHSVRLSQLTASNSSVPALFPNQSLPAVTHWRDSSAFKSVSYKLVSVIRTCLTLWADLVPHLQAESSWAEQSFLQNNPIVAALIIHVLFKGVVTGFMKNLIFGFCVSVKKINFGASLVIWNYNWYYTNMHCLQIVNQLFV